ncbi:MAG: helix-turn-helix domain-containing protein, partial [Gammaproteobacteria bacterium]|nr:helix-turn-helix domain-containing protein [Gammaproteobacteria bacterium]
WAPGQSFDTVIVVSNTWQLENLKPEFIHWLQQQYASGARLLLIGRISEALAAVGWLDDRQVACHWSLLQQLQATEQKVNWVAQLYCQDERLFTCAGGAAAADVLMAWLASIGEGELAAEVAEWLLLERTRSQDTLQRVPLQTRLGHSQPKLTEAVTLMEANLEEPLSSDELASLVGLSRRHLERLFKKHLHQVPSKFYLQLRLDRARQLLRDTDLSIVEVSMASGFSSASHFSTTYRSYYAITPRQERGRSTSVAVGTNLPNLVNMQTRLD